MSKRLGFYRAAIILGLVLVIVGALFAATYGTAHTPPPGQHDEHDHDH